MATGMLSSDKKVSKRCFPFLFFFITTTLIFPSRFVASREFENGEKLEKSINQTDLVNLPIVRVTQSNH